MRLRRIGLSQAFPVDEPPQARPDFAMIFPSVQGVADFRYAPLTMTGLPSTTPFWPSENGV